MPHLSRLVATVTLVFLSAACGVLTHGKITSQTAPEPWTHVQKATPSPVIETDVEPTRLESSADEFGRLDVNNDGVISSDEWRAPFGDFRQRDFNADGVLTRRELFLDEGGGLATADILVSARHGWTDTGLMVEAGDTVTFVADGTVQLSGDRTATARPHGSASGGRTRHAPLPQSPAGSLIARIGDAAPLFVGDLRVIKRVPARGRLYLGVNDDRLDDNSGDYWVIVTIE